MIRYAESYVGPVECLIFVVIALIVLSPIIVSVIRDTWKGWDDWGDDW